MIPYTITMTPKTVHALSHWVCVWSGVWSVEGTAIPAGAVRVEPHFLPEREVAYAHLLNARAALDHVKFTRTTAKLSLLGLTNDQISGLIWVMMVARTVRGDQKAALGRMAKLVERFNKRSPLIRLAECAL